MTEKHERDVRSKADRERPRILRQWRDTLSVGLEDTPALVDALQHELDRHEIRADEAEALLFKARASFEHLMTATDTEWIQNEAAWMFAKLKARKP